MRAWGTVCTRNEGGSTISQDRGSPPEAAEKTACTQERQRKCAAVSLPTRDLKKTLICEHEEEERGRPGRRYL